MKLRWLVALTTALGLVSGPAFAHDELVDQSPRSNEVVEAGIIEVKLTFSGNLIALGDGSGSEIVILNAESEPMNNGCAEVSGNIATAKASIDQPGIYRVGWRAVSSDGHPVSGSFRFEVVNTTGYEADPSYVFVTCPNPYIAEISEIQERNPAVIYWILFASLGVVAAGLFFLLRPKKNLS